MHSMINRAIQGFLCRYHGETIWSEIARQAGVSSEGFEPMLRYDLGVSESLIRAACSVLGCDRFNLLEDLGAYLVSLERVRRLLRFGGADYVEFLFSLDEIRERGLMTLPNVELPQMTFTQRGALDFVVELGGDCADWVAVTAGMLRAMADDYGTLAVIEPVPAGPGRAGHVRVQVLETDFSDGRSFALVEPELRGIA